MQKTVYYLVDQNTGQRLKYYATRGRARQAQRLRNSHLGFQDRIERREIQDNLEVELCITVHGELMPATWAVQEDTVDQEDLDSSSQ